MSIEVSRAPRFDDEPEYAERLRHLRELVSRPPAARSARILVRASVALASVGLVLIVLAFAVATAPGGVFAQAVLNILAI